MVCPATKADGLATLKSVTDFVEPSEYDPVTVSPLVVSLMAVPSTVLPVYFAVIELSAACDVWFSVELSVAALFSEEPDEACFELLEPELEKLPITHSAMSTETTILVTLAHEHVFIHMKMSPTGKQNSRKSMMTPDFPYHGFSLVWKSVAVPANNKADLAGESRHRSVFVD